ncbi:RNA polymerase subunit sigma-24 [Oceanobacillus arenosus]|uniref:RNA polymerase subunit sigma-24 n=1 Tax=Oceanobacillus arenosus TaxID=1229153 RepID=A0A3D8Q2L1_9BACI|nr:sigma-70 family RNA polymerase sigma factor [Oceanobacillus arenosus]RDW21871.1 RNA polymerase subunit sigma-24 [Oceanobacillus arenosus]
MNVDRLVKKAKRGSKEALLQLIMAEKDNYFRLALTYLGNSHDAMDVMEDMIVTLYEKVYQLKKEEAFYSWSKTILVNQCKSVLRKQKKLVLLDNWNTMMEEEFSSTITSDPYNSREIKIDIDALLLYLNPHQREAIQLKYFHDLDYQTIANITKAPIGTVKSRISEGLKRLGDQYRSDDDE